LKKKPGKKKEIKVSKVLRKSYIATNLNRTLEMTIANDNS